ncbi:PREDICTED: tyrosine-protein phosphatase non-receptor type 13-like [Nicrophorus vespilloides]|uniref:Tyrosine-protein phosphatase non-receptor type 13-like n=1 Tax=Nicrophorus vespilloides TaxID=110193 RepID=A0ABM1MBK1_NICVS|nr:PREDICTED: tyrosine-protein phosphatase non-receptor type 13-like [Nicrophorus vespilloides]
MIFNYYYKLSSDIYNICIKLYVSSLYSLFSDGVSGGWCIPLVTPSSLLLSARGRVRFAQNFNGTSVPPAHLSGYLAPEYRPGKKCSDTEAEKMWIFGLGEALKRATLTSHAATSRISGELCQVLVDTTRPHAASRASLMHLLDVISEYCRRRQQNRPFSHIIMDLHQEALASLEEAAWGPPAMPELRPLTRNSSDLNNTGAPRRWMNLRSPTAHKLTREASTSMENLSSPAACTTIVKQRPKSVCVPDGLPFDFQDPSFNLPTPTKYGKGGLGRRPRMRRNPVQRAASRLYRAEAPKIQSNSRDCVGPEFVVRAALPKKEFVMDDIKGSCRRSVTVILLNGQKVDVVCNPNTTTAGQLFEFVIQKEHIEENFMLGLSALMAGDFVFLPSDTRLCKVATINSTTASMTLFMRVRFFLPSLRGVRGSQARHLLYLQLRRSILEHQLPCTYDQLVELNGLALQAEFGDYNEREHGARDYFLLEHYAPETVCADDDGYLRRELIKAHRFKYGLDADKAEEDFIILAQNLPHYGGHFYTAIWVLKDGTHRDVWLYVSAQGINLYERQLLRNSQRGPVLQDKFEWKTIQTLCYSKHYLCILPHAAKMHRSQLKKYKLKMDHKKSYFTFRLASLHHQFFLRLRTEFTSLNTLSQQFGVALKDMKNETNSLYKLETLTGGTMPEFRVEFRESNSNSSCDTREMTQMRRSKSVSDFEGIEECQNKENENPVGKDTLAKRRGVKMGVRAFGNNRVCRSMEAVNVIEDSEQNSLQSVSIHCSSTSITPDKVCILESSNQFLPNFQETLSDTLMEKLNCISFADERLLRSVSIEKDCRGSLGMQITEGSDGKVYVQSVLLGGPSYMAGCIQSGDQIVAVDGKNLLSLKYDDALALLKTTGKRVEFILSQLPKSKVDLRELNETHVKSVRLERTMEKLKRLSCGEKHLTESCYDAFNHQKHDVPYQKHIRYSESESKSCSDINRAVIVDMIPKKVDEEEAIAIALPRSLGLSRKWRGPVKYPVTPIKSAVEDCVQSLSDDEQVFI